MTNPESTLNVNRTPETSADYWKKVNEKRKNSLGLPNKSKVLEISYDSGRIYGKDKDTGGGGLWTTAKKWLRKGVNVLANWGTFGNAGDFGLTDNSKYINSFKINSKYITGVSFSEYFAYDAIRGGVPPKGCDVMGCYIFPYFKGKKHAKGSESKNCPHCTSEKNVFEVDTHGLPHHFLYNHSYYDFSIYGEPYAKMHGIEKISKTNIFGFNYDIFFTSYVAWNFDCYVFYGNMLERLNYQCTIKEDLNPSDGRLTKWLAGAVGSLALAYASGGASLAATAKQGQEDVKQSTDEARTKQQEKVSESKYKDGNPWVWGKKDDKVVAKAESKAQKKADEALSADEKKQSQKMWSNVGSSYNKMAKTMQGGSGTYSSSIQEFVNNRARYPMFFVQARTSFHYQNTWLAQMNKRIATWDFYFGHDAEIALREGFGMASGVGWSKEEYKKATGDKGKKKYSILNDLHGFIQLQDTTNFPGKFNPFVDDWIGADKFIYQLRASKRPKLKKESFFEGFSGTISYGLSQQGSTDTSKIEHRNEKITRTQNPKSEGYAFCYIWCSTGIRSGSCGDGYKVSGSGKKVGYGTKITQYEIGKSHTELSEFPSGIPRGGSYMLVDFKGVKQGGEMRFGAGSEHVVLGFMKSDSGEEQVTKTPNPSATTWILKKTGTGGHGSSTVTLIGETLGVQTTFTTIETNTPGLNVAWENPIGGTSGMEAWGNNPPDSFGGGIGQETSLGIPGINQEIPGAGITLPNTNAFKMDLSMPRELGSAINPDINISKQEFEMPKTSGLEGLNTEYASGAYTASGTQDTSQAGSTDRGGDTTQSRGDDDEQTRTN